jgi:hypothetical protein
LFFLAKGLLRFASNSLTSSGVNPGAIITVVCLAIELISSKESSAKLGAAAKQLSRIAPKPKHERTILLKKYICLLFKLFPSKY